MKAFDKIFNAEYCYQLNCDSTHNMFFYINLTHEGAKLKIYRIINGYSKYHSSYSLLFQPITCGWIEKKIFLQSEKDLFLFDIETKNILNLPQTLYKIIDIVPIKEYYVYSTSIDTDYIDFYVYKGDNLDKQVASYSFLEDQYVMMNENMSTEEVILIQTYMEKLKDVRKGKINDLLEGHVLRIRNEEIYSVLSLDNTDILKIYGYIDRAFFLGKEIVYTMSSFINPQKFYSIKMKNLELVDEGQFLDFKIFTEYFENGRLGVPHYVLYLTKQRVSNIIMIHGGPVGHYVNQYDPLILNLLLMGFTVYLVNYTGSSGYGFEYRYKLYGKGGICDYEDINNSIVAVSEEYPEVPLFVLGDSYGGYLSILALLKGTKNVAKFYATNTFTDIRFQYLFSRANSVIKKYFPDISSREIAQRNPIDLALGKKLHSQLMIINGLNDDYCPPQQIYQFSDITNCEVIFLDDYPHFKVGYVYQREICELLSRDLRRIINEKFKFKK